MMYLDIIKRRYYIVMYYRNSGLDMLEHVQSPYSYIKKLNILLIRHGESECNALQANFKELGKPLTEDLKIEDALIQLTEKGVQQAIQLGIRLKEYMLEHHIANSNVLVLVSPYERARKTFELANQSLEFDEMADNVVVLNSLIEQFFGAFHMISRDVKKEIYSKIYEECSRNSISYFKPTFLGESPFDVCNRLWNAIYFLRDYTNENSIQNVFVFGHGNANKCMLMNLLNLPPEFYDSFPKATNSSIIHIQHGKFQSNTI